MPRYFFRLDGGGTVRDDTGEMLADDAAAHSAAVAVLAETIESKSDHLNGGGLYVVTVTREPDKEIYAISAQSRRLCRRD